MRFLDFCLSVFLRNLYGLGDWRGGRAGHPPGAGAGIFGAVPLGLRKNAKGGGAGTQLASLRQVFLVLQRSRPRAKRKPAPRINVLPPGISPVRCHSGSKPRRVHVLVRFRELAGLLLVEVFSRDNMLGSRACLLEATLICKFIKYRP